MPAARTEPQQLAEALAAAWRDNAPLDRLSVVDFDEEVAYGIQRRVLRQRCAAQSARLVGYKVSMTSAAGLALVGAKEPAYGCLTEADVVQSGATLSLADMNAPMLEPELVFVVRQSFQTAATEADIAARCDVAAGLEVPDSRFRGWFSNIGPFELVADSAVSGRLVVGTSRLPAAAVDLAAVTTRLLHGDDEVAAGDARAVMGDPLRSMAWLTRKLAEHGQTLDAGMVVSSGTFTMPVPADVGIYTAEFSDVGAVEVRFASQDPSKTV